MIITFCVDTSGSMNQKSANGLSLLDCAKSAIEYFIKQRTQLRERDRYFLVTCEDGPSAVKVGWKDNNTVFPKELKNLQANDLSEIGSALKKSFDLLNRYRIQNNTDNYGQGRIPWSLEFTGAVILLTDANYITSTSGVFEALTLPGIPVIPGSELTLEPFRWDQRLMTIALKIPNDSTQIYSTNLITFDPILSPMCDVTGGKCYVVQSMRGATAAVDTIITKIQQFGVVVNFECISNNPPVPLNTTQHKMIYVLPNHQTGFWPIPEPYVPDIQMKSIIARTAQPTIKYTTKDVEQNMIDGFPFDKYAIEPCGLTQHLIQNQKPTSCWQVFISNSSSKITPNQLFGYLKVNSNRTGVNLCVLPVGYPKLLNLLSELQTVHKMNPTAKWKQEFENYLHSIPPYYIQPMRNAMKHFGANSIIPDHLDATPNFVIQAFLTKAKQLSKIETDLLQTNKQNSSVSSSLSSDKFLGFKVLIGKRFKRTYPTYQNSFA